MINQMILVGRLGQNPEMRSTNGGKRVGRLSVATSTSYKKGDERIEETEWHDVIVWEKLAELCERYLAKGRLVYVQGRMKTRSYEKDGVKHYRRECIANEVKFLDKAPAKESGSDSAPANDDKPNYPDDIPF